MIARVQMNPEKLLEFVYSGEVSHMGDQLFLLFDAADRYEVMGLVCIWYLELLYFNEIFYSVQLLHQPLWQKQCDTIKCCRHPYDCRQTPASKLKEVKHIFLL